MKPTIYLGLGGTGNLAVSFTKRLYEEEYGKGNIPSSIAFVTVDFQTDIDKDPGLATNISDDFIKIESASNPRDFYRVRRENHGNFTWMFDGNTNNIDTRIAKGAKAVRTTGRLYTEMALDTIISRLSVSMTNVTYVDNTADVAAGVNIHMVMSIAGGTGAGSFLTIANAIKQKYGNKVNLYGYGVTHNVFRAMDVRGNSTPNVELNAVSSILDLDYLYTASDSNPIQIEMGMKKITLRESIFDGFFVIDNTSENGYVLKNVKTLCETIGTCLYAYGGEAGDKVENVINNVGPKEGKHHVGTKMGWVQGLGACQVVYKGNLLAEVYELKAAIELIRKIRQENADMHSKALSWTQEVAIREDGDDYNMLIDSIYSPKQIQSLRAPNLDQQDTDSANVECLKKYLVTLVDFPSDEQLASRTEELKNTLNNKIEAFLKAENGVGNSISFLKSLHKLCSKYKIEMTDESMTLNKERDDKSENFEQKSFRDYNDQKHGALTFKRGEKNQELLEEVVGRPAKEILKLTHDAKRREAAREIFIALIAKIEIMLQALSDLDQQLINLSEAYNDRLVDIQGMNSDALVFEYDLSYNDRINMTINSDNIVVSDFIRTLGKSLLTSDVLNDLSDSILEYTATLPQANDYRNRILTEVIDNLPQDEYDKLKVEIQKKSARWLRIDGRGQCVNNGGKSVDDAIAKNWVVSVYKPNEEYKSRLHNDVNFLQNVESKDFLYVNKDIAKQRMIFCRIDGSLIPYCIEAFDDMVIDRYNEQINKAKGGEMVFNPHFDKHIFEKMREEDFKLKPEMKNEAIFYWVCGHLFGWEKIKEDERIMNKDENGRVISENSKEVAEHSKYICCLRKKYMYWDVNAPAGKDKQWVALGNTSKRDTAYNYFKTIVLPAYKEEFKELISKTYSMNRTFWNSEIQRIINNGIEDYINCVVCSDKSSVTYFANSNDSETKQLQEEFQYIKKDLLNALSNFR